MTRPVTRGMIQIDARTLRSAIWTDSVVAHQKSLKFGGEVFGPLAEDITTSLDRLISLLDDPSTSDQAVFGAWEQAKHAIATYTNSERSQRLGVHG